MHNSLDAIKEVLIGQFGYLPSDEDEDFSILDYISDSFLFIQFIVSLEDILDVELPDEFLNPELFESVHGLASKIDSFIQETNL